LCKGRTGVLGLRRLLGCPVRPPSGPAGYLCWQFKFGKCATGSAGHPTGQAPSGPLSERQHPLHTRSTCIQIHKCCDLDAWRPWAGRAAPWWSVPVGWAYSGMCWVFKFGCDALRGSAQTHPTCNVPLAPCQLLKYSRYPLGPPHKHHWPALAPPLQYQAT
jgi:hypothetical protein